MNDYTPERNKWLEEFKKALREPAQATNRAYDHIITSPSPDSHRAFQYQDFPHAIAQQLKMTHHFLGDCYPRKFPAIAEARDRIIEAEHKMGLAHSAFHGLMNDPQPPALLVAFAKQAIRNMGAIEDRLNLQLKELEPLLGTPPKSDIEVPVKALTPQTLATLHLRNALENMHILSTHCNRVMQQYPGAEL